MGFERREVQGLYSLLRFRWMPWNEEMAVDAVLSEPLSAINSR
jgi:hypothetical protein